MRYTVREEASRCSGRSLHVRCQPSNRLPAAADHLRPPRNGSRPRARMIATGCAGRPWSLSSARTDGCRQTRFPILAKVEPLVLIALHRSLYRLVQKSPIVFGASGLQLGQSSHDVLSHRFVTTFL